MVDRRISGATQNDNQTAKTRNYEKRQKIVGFSKKWRCSFPSTSIALTLLRPPGACAPFVFTFQSGAPPVDSVKCKKPEFWSLSADLGAFPDLWRHTYKEFLSVINDLAYRSNETFSSRTHSFGWERLHRLSWRGRKVHRNGDYNAAHFEFCRIAWRPPGHPRRLSPVQVVSLLDTVVCSYSEQSCVGGGCLCWCVVFIISPKYWTFYHL